MNAPAKPYLVQGLDAFKAGDRPKGAQLLARELREGDGSRDAIEAVFRLASHISEIDIAVEAARRLAADGSIKALATYWSALASYGQSTAAVADIDQRPAGIREHPAAQFRLGAAATEVGEFERAQDHFRSALAKAPDFTAAWLALAQLKRFTPDDPDLAKMEQLQARANQADDRANLLYAIGKAREDIGDIDEAFRAYTDAGAIRRQLAAPDTEKFKDAATAAIADFTPSNLARLQPSRCNDGRSLFVTGLPRSGTTLTEQILRSHSAVSDGGEVNLFGAALISTLGIRFADAMAYQDRSTSGDPWGEIAREYGRLIDMRFRAPGLVVDKSLGQSLLIGLMLHSLPEARIAWLRRNPEDVALSCLRTPFAGGLSWTSSLEDIADHMRVEDRLFAHWRDLFGERILEVPYEALVTEPYSWALKLQHHFDLSEEPGLHERSSANRSVRTASVMQVREPITASRIGRSATFEQQLEPFRLRYYR